MNEEERTKLLENLIEKYELEAETIQLIKKYNEIGLYEASDAIAQTLWDIYAIISKIENAYEVMRENKLNEIDSVKFKEFIGSYNTRISKQIEILNSLTYNDSWFKSISDTVKEVGVLNETLASQCDFNNVKKSILESFESLYIAKVTDFRRELKELSIKLLKSNKLVGEYKKASGL